VVAHRLDLGAAVLAEIVIAKSPVVDVVSVYVCLYIIILVWIGKILANTTESAE
jgi:hypothetical protein